MVKATGTEMERPMTKKEALAKIESFKRRLDVLESHIIEPEDKAAWRRTALIEIEQIKKDITRLKAWSQEPMV